MENQWHLYDVKDIEKDLKTDLADGITIREARNRLEKEKRNTGGKRHSLFVGDKVSVFKSLLCIVTSPSVVLLLIISLLAMVFGHRIQGLSVFVIALSGALVGGLISLSYRRKLESAREYATPMVKVKRGGNKFYTDGRNAVVGDVILLSAGDLLPCDARIVSSQDLMVKEIISTDDGIRNRTVGKDHVVEYTRDDAVIAPDARNMLYAGTAVLKGEAVAIVVSTGSDVYLAKYLEDGALAGRDGESELVKAVRPQIYKITFVCAAALIVLSLLSLITLRGVDFISNFMMLLSSVALMTVELALAGAHNVIAHSISKMSRNERTSRKNKKDLSANVRTVKTFDKLTSVTDLVLLGTAGLCGGASHVSSAYTAKGILNELTPETKTGKRLLTYIHTYIKALRESGIENKFYTDGCVDALYAHLKSCGFDISGASLVIKSLYYAGDSKSDNGYACAETPDVVYRVAVTFDSSILSYCKHLRENAIVRDILNTDLANVEKFANNCAIQGKQCLYIVSEENGEAVFEGAVALNRHLPVCLPEVMPKFEQMGIKTTVLLSDENEDTEILISDPNLACLLGGRIARASEFRKNKLNILSGIGQYCAYVGFSIDEYANLIIAMRRSGKKVATYGIDNRFNDVMSRADVAISCDVVRYSSEKYRESVYEKLAPEGHDTNLRCSQQTRLISQIIVKRTSESGGGLSSVVNALKTARGAYVSLTQGTLLFVMLMSSLLSMTAMSVITGSVLLLPVQTAALAVVGAFLALLVFLDAEPKTELLMQKRDYISYPIESIAQKMPSIIARVSVSTVTAITVKILDTTGVFGTDTSYTMVIYLGLLLTLFAELFIINLEFNKRGEGRRSCWLRALFGYALLLGISALSTQSTVVGEFFPNGIGDTEFLILPGYILLYVIAISVAHLIERKLFKNK